MARGARASSCVPGNGDATDRRYRRMPEASPVATRPPILRAARSPEFEILSARMRPAYARKTRSVSSSDPSSTTTTSSAGLKCCGQNRIQSKGKQCRAVVSWHDDTNFHEAISETANGGESPPVPPPPFALCQYTREGRALRRPDLTLAVRVGDAKGPYRLPLKDLGHVSADQHRGVARRKPHLDVRERARLVEETKTLRVLTPF